MTVTTREVLIAVESLIEQIAAKGAVTLPSNNSTISVQQFRADFPEFASSTQYSNSQIQFWMNAAGGFLNASRWGRQLYLGIELYTAHNITLEARAQAESQIEGAPGGQVGPIASKSVDKVSVSYDTGSGAVEGGGDLNLTIYGTRLAKMIRLFGAGPVQIGMGAVPGNGGLGWSGPLCTPGFTNFGN